MLLLSQKYCGFGNFLTMDGKLINLTVDRRWSLSKKKLLVCEHFPSKFNEFIAKKQVFLKS